MIGSEMKFSDDSAQKDSRRRRCWAPKSSSEFWLTILWIVVIPLVGIITGMVFLGLGIQNRESSKDLDSSVDFVQLENKCTISEITFIKTIQKIGDKGKKIGCEDVYQYWFTALNLQDEDPAYQNITSDQFVSFDKHQKRDTNDCSRSTRVDPLLEVNDEVDCWRPSQPGADLNKWYRCGNEECIKVFPPADDVERARNIAGSQSLGGIIALSVSSGMLVIGSIITWWLRKNYYPETIPSNDRNLTGETIEF